jgi:hypothetical protein
LLELFGVRHGIPAIELPNKIDQLVSNLPVGTAYTSDIIINKHTMLPFYAPFLPERSNQLIVANMKGAGVRTTQLRAGIIAGRVKPPEFFRNCPTCDEESIKQHGETYWTRSHQVSGVDVCPVHLVLLEQTNVRLRGSARQDALISAQSAQRATVAKRLDTTKAENRILIRIAESTAWLLDRNQSRPGLMEINRGYRHVLADGGYISPKGHIRLTRLREQFADCCPATLLKHCNCELRDAGDGGWLGRLLRETEQSVAPIRHIILMAVLNISAEEFFTRVIPGPVMRPRTDPFLCLNCACPHFQQSVIPHFQIKRAKHGIARIFECPHCGHQSSRHADGKSMIRVVSFGRVWEEKLKALWSDSSASLRNVASILGADTRSVLNWAVKLGLEFPRPGPSRWTKRPNVLRVLKRVPPALLKETKRKAWCQLRHKHRTAGISELHRRYSALYTWLYRNDRKWLNANSPAHKPFVPKNDQVDWDARDAELLGRVIATAVCIKNASGRPRRVTVRSIGLELRIHTLLQMHRDKLPRTKMALEKHVESTEQFILRRLGWAVRQFESQQNRPTISEITQLAGIASKALRFPSVRQAVTDAKSNLDYLSDHSHLSIRNAA